MGVIRKRTSNNLVAPPTTRKVALSPLSSVKPAAIDFLLPVLSRPRRGTSPGRSLGLGEWELREGIGWPTPRVRTIGLVNAYLFW